LAGGWARDGAIQDQIDDTLKDAVALARTLLPTGEGSEHCDDCGETIPSKRRASIPGAGGYPSRHRARPSYLVLT